MGKKGELRSCNKVSVGLPMAQVSQEAETLERDEAAGRGAVVVAVQGDAAAGTEIMLRMPKARLHCPACTLPLKPPIFQCEAGHLVCGACPCRDLLPSIGRGRCYACPGTGTGTCIRCRVLEGMVRSVAVLCPYDAYGCRSYVTYYDVADHQGSCPHAPCRCSESGCGGFVGSPAMLRDHLAAPPHEWPVDRITYGRALQLLLPEPEPGQGRHRRLLVAEEDDGRVFLLSVGALGPGLGGAPFGASAMSLVCVRANDVAGQRYVWRLCAAATGKAENVAAEMDVPCSAAPAEVAMEDAACLLVPGRMLQGAQISVRIEKII